MKQQKLIDWAKPISRALDSAFFSVFNRVPTSDDVIEVHEFALLNAMVLASDSYRVFALVEPSGQVHLVEEYGYESLHFDPESNRFV